MLAQAVLVERQTRDAEAIHQFLHRLAFGQ
jgi:hypothetical protein